MPRSLNAMGAILSNTQRNASISVYGISSTMREFKVCYPFAPFAGTPNSKITMVSERYDKREGPVCEEVPADAAAIHSKLRLQPWQVVPQIRHVQICISERHRWVMPPIPPHLGAWQNTAGTLFDIVCPKTTAHRPQLACRRKRPVSSSLRFRAVLFQPCIPRASHKRLLSQDV